MPGTIPKTKSEYCVNPSSVINHILLITNKDATPISSPLSTFNPVYFCKERGFTFTWDWDM